MSDASMFRNLSFCERLDFAKNRADDSLGDNEGPMNPFLTPQESIALDLIFACMGESRINRTLDAYMNIAARAPKLVALHAEINRYLQQIAASGYVPFEICTFKGSSPGRERDRYYRYEKFPTSMSMETIRRAWVKSGMRELQRQQRLTSQAA